MDADDGPNEFTILAAMHSIRQTRTLTPGTPRSPAIHAWGFGRRWGSEADILFPLRSLVLLPEEYDAPVLGIGDRILPLLPDDLRIRFPDLFETHRKPSVTDLVNSHGLNVLQTSKDQFFLAFPLHLKGDRLHRNAHHDGHDRNHHHEHDEGVAPLP